MMKGDFPTTGPEPESVKFYRLLLRLPLRPKVSTPTDSDYAALSIAPGKALGTSKKGHSPGLEEGVYEPVGALQVINDMHVTGRRGATTGRGAFTNQ